LRKNLLRAIVSVCAFAAVSAALAGDNWMGSWKLDVGASIFSPGPAPTAQLLKIEADTEGIRVSSEIMDAQGKMAQGSYVSEFDGKDVPWTGNPNADTSSAKRIDANSYENTWKKEGKATIRAKVTVSKNGKTLTIRQTGADAQGKLVDNTEVFRRM